MDCVHKFENEVFLGKLGTRTGLVGKGREKVGKQGVGVVLTL